MRTRFGMGLLAALLGLSLSSVVQADDLKRGENLYGLCEQCHGAAGEGNQAALAPAIAGMDQWYVEAQLKNFRSGTRGMHPDDKGGLRMYPMSRALKQDDEIQDVSAYVASLPPVQPDPVVVGGDPAKGKALYALCQQCHGAAGEGNKTMNSPPLVGTNDWYLVGELHEYKKGVRGGNPANPNAVMMRGMSNSLADDQAIKDVVAHIMTLKRAD